MRKQFSHGVYVPSVREVCLGAVQNFDAPGIHVSMWNDGIAIHVCSLVEGRTPYRVFNSYRTLSDARRAWSRAVTEAKKGVK